MTLSKYTNKRLVVLNSNASAYDAVRAMEDNHVGVVLVHDGELLVGVVTDRDLALQVIGSELVATDLPLSALIDGAPATLPVTASERDAAQLMRDRHVRRIPIVDGPRAVGLITLDDLIVGQGVDGTILAEIVRAQLAEPSRLKQEGEVHPVQPEQTARAARAERRRTAHAAQSYGELISRVMTLSGLGTRERAQTALDIVIAGIVQRISANEAHQLLAELPRVVRERNEHLAHGPDRTVTMHAIEAELAQRLELSHIDARAAVLNTCTAFGSLLSAGELDDVRSQLPGDMRNMLLGVEPI